MRLAQVCLHNIIDEKLIQFILYLYHKNIDVHQEYIQAGARNSRLYYTILAFFPEHHIQKHPLA